MDQHPAFHWTMHPFLVVLLAQSVSPGADDVVADHVPAKAVRRVGQQFVPVMNFGVNLSSRRDQFDDEIQRRVDDAMARHQLTEIDRAKLKLAAAIDVNRFCRDVDEWQRKFESGEGDPGRMQRLALENQRLQQKQFNLFGRESFLAKVLVKVIAAEKVARRHSGIEEAVRELESHVSLHSAQREALVELLSRELPKQPIRREVNDAWIRYHVSQLAENSLKSMFHEDQWPEVRTVLDSYQKLRTELIDKGLIFREPGDAGSPLKRKSNSRGNKNIDHPADATRPEVPSVSKPSLD